VISVIYNAIFETMTARGCKFTKGGDIRDLAQQGDAPRVVMFPTTDRFEAPMTIGGNPKPLMNRWITTEAHLWGLTVDHIDQLIAQVACCVWIACKEQQRTSHAGMCRMGAGQWVVDQARDTNRGYQYVLLFDVLVPILDRKWTDDGLAPDPNEQASYREPTVNVNPIISTVNETIQDQIADTVTITEESP